MKKGIVILCCLMVLIVGCAPVNPVPPEVIAARDQGIQNALAQGVVVPQAVNWSGRNITPQGLVGYSTFKFTASVGEERWQILVGYPVIPFPEYQVTIGRNGLVVWEGTVAFPTPMVPQHNAVS